MKLSRFLKGLTKDGHDGAKDKKKHEKSCSPEHNETTAPESESARAGGEEMPSPDTPAQSESPLQNEQDNTLKNDELDHVASMFGSIQSVLGEDDEPATIEKPETVGIPAAILLKNLPAECQGPQYNRDGFPDLEITLDLSTLLEKLKAGEVKIPLAQVNHLLPEGWVVNSNGHEVQLDLPDVVATVPPHLLSGAEQKSQSFRDLENSEDLFQAEIPTPEKEKADPRKTASANSETSSTATPIRTAAETAEQPGAQAQDTAPRDKTNWQKKPKCPAPVGWDGIETSLTAGGGIDINSASLEELTSIPGVGPSRARQIIKFRENNGPFKHIYELMNMPGFGPKLFSQATGLSPRTGRNRRTSLNQMLNFTTEADPSLQQLAEAFKKAVSAEGCILSNDDGVPLASTSGIQADADRYAAVNTQLFRRTAKYLHGLTGAEVECISLPIASPPLILFTVNNIYLVLVQGERLLTLRDFEKAKKITAEIGWLLGPRAVVRHI